MSELKALQKLWYEKLRQSGFDDIEAPSKPKLLSGHYAFRIPAKQRIARTQYYERAQSFAHILEAGVDAQCWEMHSQGDPVRVIATVLNLSKSNVHRRIQRIKLQVGL